MSVSERYAVRNPPTTPHQPHPLRMVRRLADDDQLWEGEVEMVPAEQLRRAVEALRGAEPVGWRAGRVGEIEDLVPLAVAENLAAALEHIAQFYVGGWPDDPGSQQRIGEIADAALAEYRAAYPAKETP